MRFGIWRAGSAAVLLALAGCDGSVPPDEALARARRSGGDYANLGPGTEPEAWRKAAEQLYPPAYRDYFEGMDAVGKKHDAGNVPLHLDGDQVVGRNAWVMWTAGNEAWWDWLARYGYGTVDLLKLVDDRERPGRFGRTGLLNEPGMRPPTEEETKEAHGVRYARPITEPGPGGEAHVEYRKDRQGWAPPDPNVYGYPTGVVGLRLFPNPDFDAAAARRWNPRLYYEDSPEGHRYTGDPGTVRPFRVGMSCGYCHIAPHPLKPPADVENPRWENLSNNIGNQFLRMRVGFANALEPDNYFYQVFDSMLPGAVDTSGHPSDNNNNPNTVNAFFGLLGRLERAGVTSKEFLSHDSLAYVKKYTDEGDANPRHLPKVLLDGSDSVGVHLALSRVYLNIGTHHQQWLRTINPFIGFAPQKGFKLEDIAENSLYWHATRIRIRPMASFFTVATDPMRLKDVDVPANDAGQDDKDPRKVHLRGTGLPWYTLAAEKAGEAKPAEPAGDGPLVGKAGDYAEGRRAFARGCIACHSSIQPGDLPELEQELAVDADSLLPAIRPLPEDSWSGPRSEWDRRVSESLAERRRLRLSPEDRARLTRGDGALPAAYAEWAGKAVEQRVFWEHEARAWYDDGSPMPGPGGRQKRTTIHNYMSIDERIPITVVGTNSGRATGTNSLHGHVWEDFASETYKELDAVGQVRYRDPFSGADKSFSPPGGGVGYYRVPTLISAWSTAPFFHNNSLGTFNNDPSVKGRLAAFDDAIGRLLWPGRRQAPSDQRYWPGDGAATTVADAWFKGKDAYLPVSQQESKLNPTALARSMAADQRETDGGWIWRTSKESWFQFDAPHVPMLVGGVIGIDRYTMQIIAFVPALTFLALGVLLLINGRLNSIWDRLGGRLTWLSWLLGPFKWLITFGSLAIAVVAGYLILYRFRPAIYLLDLGTQGYIPLFWLQVFLIPVLLFGSAALLSFPHRFRGSLFARLTRVAGVACVLMSVVTALWIGRTLAGMGANVRIGPIPEGIPVSVIANLDPLAPRKELLEAGDKLIDYLSRHQADARDNPDDVKARDARRTEFQESVAPALLKVSKCPDFVIDRGHDYVFMRDMTDREKSELIALIKTF